MGTVAKLPVNTSSWMQQYKGLLQSRLISELVLPGTHNSAAYRLSSEIQPCYCFRQVFCILAKLEKFAGYLRSWSYCQSLNIWMQLSNGVRYLDLRVTWNRETWHIHHALLGVRLEEVLSDISKFLEIHSQEIVLMSIKCEADLMEPLKAFVRTRLLSIPYEKVRDCRVREIIHRNRRAIICWQGSPGFLNMKGSWSRTHWLNKMMSFNRTRLWERISKGSERRQLFKISWTLTFRFSLPFGLWHGRSSVEALSIEANKYLRHVVNWAELCIAETYNQESSNNRKHGFILSVDYFNRGLNLTEKCIEIMQILNNPSRLSNGNYNTRNVSNSFYKRKP